MQRTVGSLAFGIARLPCSGPLVRLLFAHGSRWLPVARLYESGAVLAFRHPRPESPGHALIVPKRAIRGVEELSEVDGGLLVEVLRAARVAADASGSDRYEVIVNAGAFQDIRQLHFHMLPRH